MVSPRTSRKYAPWAVGKRSANRRVPDRVARSGSGSSDFRDRSWSGQSLSWGEGERLLDGLKAWFVAHRIQERVDLQYRHTRVAQADRFLEPGKRLGDIPPLRVDLGVLVCDTVTVRGLEARQHRFGVGVAPELLVSQGQAGQNTVEVSGGIGRWSRAFARGACALIVARIVV